MATSLLGRQVRIRRHVRVSEAERTEDSSKMDDSDNDSFCHASSSSRDETPDNDASSWQFQDEKLCDENDTL